MNLQKEKKKKHVAFKRVLFIKVEGKTPLLALTAGPMASDLQDVGVSWTLLCCLTATEVIDIVVLLGEGTWITNPTEQNYKTNADEPVLCIVQSCFLPVIPFQR